MKKLTKGRKLMLVLLTIYLTLVGFLFIFQRKLQYIPMGKLGNISEYNLDQFEEKILTTSDNTKILAWYKKPELGQKIIVHFHGNAGNLGDRSHKFDAFAKSGFGVLAITYRGYPGSTGKPSEKGFIEDGIAALHFLCEENGFEPKDLILFGESIGSGVATQLAANANFAAVILEAPFSSAASVAQKIYWFVPVKWMLKDKFESIKSAPQIISPTLIFHKTKDHVVPYSEGKKLFEAIQSPKKFVTVEGFGHVDFEDEFLVKEMKDFLQSI
jgi:uncharacterized protein